MILVSHAHLRFRSYQGVTARRLRRSTFVGSTTSLARKRAAGCRPAATARPAAAARGLSRSTSVSARRTGIWRPPTSPSRHRNMSAEPRTLADLGRLLKSRAVTAEAATEGCLARIAERNRSINAFITVLADEALTQAQEADREIAAGRYRGPLHGVPISLKDIIDLRDTPTTAASRVRDGHIAQRDATVVGATARGGSDLRRQDQPPRVRARHDQRGLRLRPGRASARRHPLAGRLLGRLGGVGAAPDGVRVDRHRHRRLGSHSIGGVRSRRPEADDRRDSDRRRRAAERDARSRRAACAGRSKMRRSLYGVLAGRRESRGARGARGSRSAVRRSARATSSTCSIRRSRRGSTRPATQLDRRRGDARGRRRSRTRKRSGRSTCTSRWPRRRPITRRRSKAGPRTTRTNVRLRLEMGRYILAEDYVRAQRGRQVLTQEVDEALDRTRRAAAAVASGAGDQARRCDGVRSAESKNRSATSRCD